MWFTLSLIVLILLVIYHKPEVCRAFIASLTRTLMRIFAVTGPACWTLLRKIFQWVSSEVHPSPVSLFFGLLVLPIAGFAAYVDWQILTTTLAVLFPFAKLKVGLAALLVSLGALFGIIIHHSRSTTARVFIGMGEFVVLGLHVAIAIRRQYILEYMDHLQKAALDAAIAPFSVDYFVVVVAGAAALVAPLGEFLASWFAASRAGSALTFALAGVLSSPIAVLTVVFQGLNKALAGEERLLKTATSTFEFLLAIPWTVARLIGPHGVVWRILVGWLASILDIPKSVFKSLRSKELAAEVKANSRVAETWRGHRQAQVEEQTTYEKQQQRLDNEAEAQIAAANRLSTIKANEAVTRVLIDHVQESARESATHIHPSVAEALEKRRGSFTEGLVRIFSSPWKSIPSMLERLWPPAFVPHQEEPDTDGRDAPEESKN